ncbi:hypothetical protein [Natrinema salsiterrestre]|uniref:Uncharacterized protein n=1 Tax=Natrinema salsiterrestre TaxID=2950540 RepID=A0A9Q4LAK0_9EURY|nr:hypothetical protein [Natrinema salsiterrestre]MDF9748391.1 hypothetical protein [Natrinema salsiterrestre]
MIESIALYAGGVAVGAAVTTMLFIFRFETRSKVTETLLVETIGQHAFLRATKEVVDDETDEQIKARGQEILEEEYDLDVVDVGGESDA